MHNATMFLLFFGIVAYIGIAHATFKKLNKFFNEAKHEYLKRCTSAQAATRFEAYIHYAVVFLTVCWPIPYIMYFIRISTNNHTDRGKS